MSEGARICDNCKTTPADMVEGSEAFCFECRAHIAELTENYDRAIARGWPD